MNSMIIQDYNGFKKHYICMDHPRLFLGDGVKPNATIIPTYSRDEAKEKGWREIGDSMWRCPECVKLYSRYSP